MARIEGSSLSTALSSDSSSLSSLVVAPSDLSSFFSSYINVSARSNTSWKLLSDPGSNSDIPPDITAPPSFICSTERSCSAIINSFLME